MSRRRDGKVRRIPAWAVAAAGALVLAVAASIGSGVGAAILDAAGGALRSLTAASGLCDERARFVDEMPTDENGHFQPGEPLVKVWRWKNEGNCDWGDRYVATFVGGDRLGATADAPLRARRGETAEVRVRLTAPSSPGEYCADWALRNPSGRDIRTEGMWVVVIVDAPPPAPKRTPRPRVNGCPG